MANDVKTNSANLKDELELPSINVEFVDQESSRKSVEEIENVEGKIDAEKNSKLYSDKETESNWYNGLTAVTIVGIHKQYLPKPSYLFVISITREDNSQVTIYRKFKEICFFQKQFVEELETVVTTNNEALWYLKKFHKRATRHSFPLHRGSMRRLRKIKAINLFFEALTYYCKCDKQFQTMKDFFILTEKDFDASNWSKEGKTFFYVNKPTLSRNNNKPVPEPRKKCKSNDDIIKKSDSFASLKMDQKMTESRPSQSQNIHLMNASGTYVAVDNYNVAENDSFDNVLELVTGEKVEVLNKSATGWWLVKKQDQARDELGYVPGSYLQPEDMHYESTNHSSNPAPFRHSYKSHKKQSSKRFARSFRKISKTKDTYISIKAYTAQQADELSFEEGSVFQILKKYADGWWCARLKKDEGLVPGVYLKKYNDPMRKLNLEIFNLNKRPSLGGNM